jgi:hypothetical protein
MKYALHKKVREDRLSQLTERVICYGTAVSKQVMGKLIAGIRQAPNGLIDEFVYADQ